ncbi:MAG TPA: MmcQ/YjbR family DNA-binding protein [Candidatus Nitrosotalea sp.]|nr:MmcQ/YjbR family DNA-binding protein [Candidatus Nitrosotalea sp.]
MGRRSTRALHPSRDGVAAPLARLRRICRVLPGTSEKVSHGEPTFWVGGRMFAQFDDHHHGGSHVGVWLAMPLGAQEALVYADPKRYFVPPYVGPRGWVGMRLDGRPTWKKVEQVVREAYDHIAARTRPRAETAAPRGRRR